MEEKELPSLNDSQPDKPVEEKPQPPPDAAIKSSDGHTDQNISPQEPAPGSVKQSEAEEPTIHNSKPVTEKEMEVHHHSHAHGKKNWKSYFWEFLMLFLAVFCGFLAEYQLEHVIEHQREKTYMASLLEDLMNDTSDLTRSIGNWERVIQKADTLRNELSKQFEVRDNKLVYRLANDLNYNNNFVYHDRTIGQLKYAGNFRLIRKKSIADSLVAYDAVYQTAIKTIEELYRNITRPELLSLQSQFLNSKFYEICNNPLLFDSAIKKELDIIFIKKGKEDIVFQYYNRLYEFRRLNRNRVIWQKTLLRRAVNLIKLIKKEYHLE